MSSRPAAFLIFIFVSTTLSSDNNFCKRFIHDFKKVPKPIHEMFFPLLNSFFLPGSLLFCSRGALSSAHFNIVCHAIRDCLSSEFMILLI